MPEDPDLDRRLAGLLTQILRDHLPQASSAGHVTQFVIGAQWRDESPSSDSYLFYSATPLAAYGLLKWVEATLEEELDESARRSQGWDSED